jgi:tRNA G18 (ribose-2'-O)-methylase SpoU
MPSIREITSLDNPRFKLLRALSASRGVRRHRRALVCGRRLVEEVAGRHPDRVESLVHSAASFRLAEEVAPADVGEVLVLPAALFRQIDPFGVDPPLAVVRVDPLPRWDPARDRAPLTLFLPLGDPENVGAALRSAAAFAVELVVLLEEAAHPFHPRAIRAAAGACFDLELRAGPALATLLESPPATLELLVLDRDGESIERLEPQPDRGLVVGEEGRGAPPRSGLRRISIPIREGVESLNAAVAIGIALWELRGRSPRRRAERAGA